MIFSIVNPSDPYTMDASSLLVAAVAICLLGEGQYGLRQCDGEGDAAVPPFVVGGHETYFMRQFGRTFADAMHFVDENHLEELAAALGSVLYGGIDERREAMMAMHELPEETRIAWLLQWHDEHRSSANDIGRRAWHWSNVLTGKLQTRNASKH